MRLKKGSWYYFKFADHSKDTNSGDEIYLELCGKVEKVTKKYVHLIYWTCISSNGDKAAENNNHERAVIVKSAIVKRKKLPL